MPPETAKQALSREVKRALTAARLSVPAAAKKLGWERKRLYRWIDGSVSPRIEDVEHFSKVVGQPLAISMGPGTTKEPPPDWAEAMEKRIVNEVVANRETLYAALAADLVKAQLGGRTPPPDAPPDGKRGPQPGGAGPRPAPPE